MEREAAGVDVAISMSFARDCMFRNRILEVRVMIQKRWQYL